MNREEIKQRLKKIGYKTDEKGLNDLAKNIDILDGIERRIKDDGELKVTQNIPKLESIKELEFLAKEDVSIKLIKLNE